MRQVAIRYIGGLKDSASLDELIRIYDADKTKEIRFSVIRALSEREDPRARSFLKSRARAKRRSCASKRSGASASAAWPSTICSSSTPAKQTCKSNKACCARRDNADPRARTKLLEIARGNEGDRAARLCHSTIGRERRRANRQSTCGHVRHRAERASQECVDASVWRFETEERRPQADDDRSQRSVSRATQSSRQVSGREQILKRWSFLKTF